MRYTIFLIFLLSSVGVLSQNANNFSCDQAIEIQVGNNCFTNSNSNSTTASISSCNEDLQKDIWYHFTGEQNALYRLEASLSEYDSLFNNTLTIYSGSCGNLQELTCHNEDEYGFLGEVAYLNITQSEEYYVKVSGSNFDFGRTSGQCCLALSETVDLPTAAAYDICEQASALYLNDDFITFNSKNASFDGDYISGLERNRSDVWFVYEHNVDTDLLIESNADFSHTIGLYSGSCSDLSLIEKNLSGFSLSANGLSPDESYYIQISGSFSTLQGEIDLKITSTIAENVNNDDCMSSTTYEGECLAFSTLSASFSDQYPSCLFYVQNDLWFDFTPDISGTYKLNIESDYLFNVAVYKNDCSDLEIVECENASPCEGAIDIKNLNAGERYLIQILSNMDHFDNEGGLGCLEITHTSDYEFYPLSLEVSTICISESIAILDVQAKNGKGNYTFYGNVDGEELAEGSSYFVQVTDEMGCQKIQYGTVSCSQPNNNCDLYFNVETTDIDCSAESGGSATLSVYNEASYTIYWSTGETTNTISDLAPGQYSVEISNDVSGICNHVFEIIEQVESFETYYADLDEDGFGDLNNFIKSCNQVTGYLNNSLDCDDNNPNINTDMSEITYNGIDDDCDPETLDDDLDQDGFVLAEDCDDNNPNINADMSEVTYNGIDDDCDPETLDDDLDQDGFVLAEDCDDNNPNINTDMSEVTYNGIDDDCDPETLDDDLDQDGFVLAEDCDDNNPNINPNTTEEAYNGIDDDCDPETLDDDLDQDGFVLSEDCDDNNPDINPDAEEIPNNGIDEDCDGLDLVSSMHEIAKSKINIYPNPSFDRINIDIQGQLNFQANLYNLEGKLIRSISNSRLIQVDIIPSGIYLLEIRDIVTGQRIIERIVIGK